MRLSLFKPEHFEYHTRLYNPKCSTINTLKQDMSKIRVNKLPFWPIAFTQKWKFFLCRMSISRNGYHQPLF